jgi:hypothetical protein
MLVSADRYTTEYFSAPAPDGNAGGFPGTASARDNGGARGTVILMSEIWLLRYGPSVTTSAFSEGGAESVADVGKERPQHLLRRS